MEEIADREIRQALAAKPPTAPIRMTMHKWTDEEDDYIRVNYRQSGESAQRIADALKLTRHQVKARAMVLGVGGITAHTKRWTPEEDKQLRELIHKYSINTISNIMNRSSHAVKVRATRLKMCLRSHNGWYTKKDCCEILGVDHKYLQRFIASGALKASYHNGRKPGKAGMAMWHIEGKDLREFIIKYPQEFQGRNVNLIKIVDLLKRGQCAEPNN
jgi:pyruvate dehydrogenase complex dehydrogenase (E1) component